MACVSLPHVDCGNVPDTTCCSGPREFSGVADIVVTNITFEDVDLDNAVKRRMWSSLVFGVDSVEGLVPVYGSYRIEGDYVVFSAPLSVTIGRNGDSVVANLFLVPLRYWEWPTRKVTLRYKTNVGDLVAEGEIYVAPTMKVSKGDTNDHDEPMVVICSKDLFAKKGEATYHVVEPGGTVPCDPLVVGVEGVVWVYVKLLDTLSSIIKNQCWRCTYRLIGGSTKEECHELPPCEKTRVYDPYSCWTLRSP